MTKIKVQFRLFTWKSVSGREYTDLLALFPYELGSANDPDTCDSWDWENGGSAANHEYIIDNSVPAKKEDYIEMLEYFQELCPETKYVVIQKAGRKAYDSRLEQYYEIQDAA